jgi:hypothetical protein
MKKILFILLTAAIFFGCTKEDPIINSLVGEWERYIPEKNQIELTGDLLILNTSQAGVFNAEPITWTSTDQEITFTFLDGRILNLFYLLDDDLILFTETGATVWARKTR